eukprot:4452373-Prymnesium_polylepis.2
MPKAAKVTHPPRRPSNCESDPPLKILLPPRGAETRRRWPLRPGCDRRWPLRAQRCDCDV